MHVLMTETSSAQALPTADALRSRGHHVHACHDDLPGACRSKAGLECPLETAPVDVVVGLRHAGSSESATSVDAVQCAVRRKVPVVMSDGEPVDAVEAVAAAPLIEHSDVASALLRNSLMSAGISFDRADAKVRRLHGGLVVHLNAEPPLGNSASLRSAVSVYRRLRELDPWARTIDIRSATPTPPGAQSGQTLSS